MQDRRGFDRLKLDGNVSIKSENGRPMDFKAFLENISFVGFGMYSAHKVDRDSIVEFELSSQPLDQPLTGTGRVKYVVEPAASRSAFYNMGIEFIDTNKDLVTYLIKKVQAKMAEDARGRSHTAHIDFIPY
jgi:hypothetical protein